jgi:tRNA nucleotidyltransferase/poly(A) polymerase
MGSRPVHDIDPSAARKFATHIVRQLHDKGYEALLAGGCVRDQLLGRIPKDYDVATNATPGEIRRALKQRTIPVGAAFGVITVVGPQRAGNVEVATFRRDATYSDGRHPDSVTFTNSREDALRRDFTINGLFWDPLQEQVVDYVGGQQDLAQGVVRAIGDPHIRIQEDKLRMLRAVRFAAVFDFSIDSTTFESIREHAHEIVAISAERISDEFRRMLTHPNRRIAAELLRTTGLLAAIIPEAPESRLYDTAATEMFRRTCDILDHASTSSFAVILAILLREVAAASANYLDVVTSICRRGRLSNLETDTILFCLSHESLVRTADQQSWPRLQPVLTHPLVDSLLEFGAAVAGALDHSQRPIDFCRACLAWPAAKLNPPPLITGNDLRKLGIPKGPIYRKILQEVRHAQLLELVTDHPGAIALARKIWLGEQGP